MDPATIGAIVGAIIEDLQKQQAEHLSTKRHQEILNDLQKIIILIQELPGKFEEIIKEYRIKDLINNVESLYGDTFTNFNNYLTVKRDYEVKVGNPGDAELEKARSSLVSAFTKAKLLGPLPVYLLANLAVLATQIYSELAAREKNKGQLTVLLHFLSDINSHLFWRVRGTKHEIYHHVDANISSVSFYKYSDVNAGEPSETFYKCTYTENGLKGNVFFTVRGRVSDTTRIPTKIRDQYENWKHRKREELELRLVVPMESLRKAIENSAVEMVNYLVEKSYPPNQADLEYFEKTYENSTEAQSRDSTRVVIEEIRKLSELRKTNPWYNSALLSTVPQIKLKLGFNFLSDGNTLDALLSQLKDAIQQQQVVRIDKEGGKHIVLEDLLDSAKTVVQGFGTNNHISHNEFLLNSAIALMASSLENLSSERKIKSTAETSSHLNSPRLFATDKGKNNQGSKVEVQAQQREDAKHEGKQVASIALKPN